MKKLTVTLCLLLVSIQLGITGCTSMTEEEKIAYEFEKQLRLKYEERFKQKLLNIKEQGLASGLKFAKEQKRKEKEIEVQKQKKAMNALSQSCNEFGFKKGTESHSQCMLDLFKMKHSGGATQYRGANREFHEFSTTLTNIQARFEYDESTTTKTHLQI